MTRAWIVGSVSLALGAVVWMLAETRRLAEVAGGHEVAARDARAAAARAAAEVLRLQAAAPIPAPAAAPAAAVAGAAAGGAAASGAVDAKTYAELRLELATTQQRLAAVEELLAQKQREAEARAAVAAAAELPISEGVRTCLFALHDRLRREGFTNLRFLGASAIVDGELRDVEVLDVAADQLSVAFLRGKRMTAVLDRSISRLSLRFFEGERKVAGASTPLPEDGFAILFDGVDGPGFEAALPYLLRIEGSYPPPPVGEARLPSVDPGTRAQWIERVDGLLQRAGTSDRWRIARFRSMQDGWFLDVDLVASDQKNHVVGGAHCARLAVELDPKAGIVSLRMVDGVLRQAGGESSIGGEGYRMLLPNLNCKQASDAMMGIVVSK
ncbi:MAG: hypothetical protein ACK501_07375 [Planctomycetota bacterium]